MTLDHLQLDALDLESFARVAANFGQDRFGYVVTPNTDHFARLGDQPELRPLYDDAAYCLLDSRMLSHVIRLLRSQELPVCLGSDLTARLFERVIEPNDRVVLIGSSAEQAESLRAKYELTQLTHFNPPFGFILDPDAVEECLQFIEGHSPFRFCFLAVGSPQQEKVAHELKTRGLARGMALCVGASINFITGTEQRAPQFMQRLGLEWMFRLLHDPKRLWRRYLVHGPRGLRLVLRSDLQLRMPR